MKAVRVEHCGTPPSGENAGYRGRSPQEWTRILSKWMKEDIVHQPSDDGRDLGKLSTSVQL